MSIDYKKHQIQKELENVQTEIDALKQKKLKYTIYIPKMCSQKRN